MLGRLLLASIMIGALSGPARADTETVGGFVAKCKAQFADAQKRKPDPDEPVGPCTVGVWNAMKQAWDAHVMQGKPKRICMREHVDMPALEVAVVNWLEAHPDLKDRPADEGVSAALAALYPCK